MAADTRAIPNRHAKARRSSRMRNPDATRHRERRMMEMLTKVTIA
jgi:hypothetical protein